MPQAEVIFPASEIKALENQALHGDRARQVRDGKDWEWIKEYIFGAMKDQAINILQNAKTEEDRVKAQQMFLACAKPIQLMDFLINQGDAATASLAEVASSTLENTEEENNG